MAEPRNLQELLRQRQERAFVGRLQQRATFKTNLEFSAVDRRRRFITAISGQAGMGKSAFMNQCRETSVDAGYATTWIDETLSLNNLVELMRTMAEDLGSDREFTSFHSALSRYRDDRHRLETHGDAPEELARVVAAATGRIGTQLARGIPLLGGVFELVDEQVAGDQMGQVAAFVLRQTKQRQDALLLLQPVETLTPLFLEGLEAVAEDRPVAVFLDTWEETGATVEPWLLKVLNGEFGSVPLNLLVTIAGQRALDPNVWSSFESLTQHISLDALSERESIELLANKGIVDLAEAREMVRLAHGIPIQLVSIAAATDHLNPSDTLVERVLKSVQEDLRPAALLAAIPRTLNRDVSDVLFDDATPSTAFDELRTMPFVEPSTAGWKYHSVIRAELFRHGLRDTPSTWTEHHLRLAAHFAGVRDKLVRSSDYGRANEADAEFIYHGLCARSDQALEKALRRCIRAFGVDAGHARPWAVAIRDAERDLQETGKGRWGVAWLHAIDEYISGHETALLSILGRAQQVGVLQGDAMAELLKLRSDTYRGQSRLDAALADIERALQLRPEDHELVYQRALIRLDRRDFELALEDCAAAVAQVEMGDPKFFTYRVMQVRMSLQVDEPSRSLELINEVLKEAPHPWAFLTRGQIRRKLQQPEQGIADFEQVLELAPDHAHEAWKEIALCRIEMDQTDRAEEALQKALEEQPLCTHCWEALARLYAGADLDRGVQILRETCSTVTDPNLPAYRARGLLRLGCWQPAIDELEKALDHDPDSPDYHLWLARALTAADRPTEALKEVEHALRLRPQWPDALALRGNVRFHVGDHQLAIDDWTLAENTDPRSDSWIDPGDRALALSVTGRYQDAIELCDKAEGGNQRPDIVYNRVIASATLHGHDAVESDLLSAERLLRNVEIDVVRLYGLAGLRAVRGDLEPALGPLKEAISVDPPKVLRWLESDPAWHKHRESPGFLQVLETAVDTDQLEAG